MIANPTASHPPTSPVTPVPAEAMGTVLVVEDDETQRDLLAHVLAFSHRVETAGSAAEALAKVREATPALVIMDYSMPGMSGIEGLKRLREIEPLLPVVILTGHADIEIARQAIESGAAEYILKPFDTSDLLSVVSRLVARKAPPAGAPVAPAPEEPTLQRRAVGGVDLWRGRLPTVTAENRVLATLDDSCRVEAKVLRLSRTVVHAEVYDPNLRLEPGQAVARLQVWVGEKPVYDGPAELATVVATGVARICEFAMRGDWIQGGPDHPAPVDATLDEATRGFIARWRSARELRPEFMLAVAAAAAFLAEMRAWLEGLELTWQRDEGEPESLEHLLGVATPVLNEVLAPFEAEALRVPEAVVGIHAEHVRSVLHPLVLCAPFVHRCFTKPLGYPGDFGIMNRMLDAPFEGEGLYARILNAWVIRSGAGDAYRHRVHFLENVLRAEGARVAATTPGRTCRVLSLGCGAAREVQHFVRHDPLAGNVDFTLLDFNADTIQHAREQIEAAAHATHQNLRVTAVEFSVHQMLAAGGRLIGNPQRQRSGILERGSYDVVYCAGLFDYLSDRVCKRLMEIFWVLAAPGATVVACNFTPANPIRSFMDYVLDWRLTYRTPEQMRSLAVPEPLEPDVRIVSDPGGVEVFLRMRKSSSSSTREAEIGGQGGDGSAGLGRHQQVA